MNAAHTMPETRADDEPAAAAETRVWLLTNCPSPYQVELLSKVHREPGVDLTVRFMQPAFRDSEPPPKLADLNHSTLSWIGVPGNRDELKLHPRAVRDTFFGNYDVFVLSGLYTSPTFLLCAIALWLRRSRFVLWLERPSDANRPDLTTGQKVLRAPFVLYRRVLLSFLLRRAARVLCMGSRAVDQYETYGLDRARADSLPYCCDTSRFEHVDPAARDRVVTELGLQDRVVFLFSGQLIRRKGPDVALEAFRRLARTHSDVAFVVLGDGPLRASLADEFVRSTPAPVLFVGHQPQESLPAYFAAADIFVLPSRQDGWAVVINEACAAGLPVIASVQTGAAHDLVQPGHNGERLEWNDIEGFHEAMRALAESQPLREQYGQNSRALVQRFTVDCGAQKFCAGILAAVRS